MHQKFLFLLFFLLIGCTVGVETAVSTPPPLATQPPQPNNAITTDTPAPIEPTTQMPTPLPTNTPPPTDTPMPTATETATATATPNILTANGVQFEMPDTINSKIFPIMQGDWLRRFSFAQEGLCREVGCITVYEIESFRTEFFFGDDVIDSLIESLDQPASEHIPTWGAAILLKAQVEPLSFQNGNGRRALVMRGQNSFFANNEAIVYDYHGLTEDGRYYINVRIPIDHPLLIDTFDPTQNSNPNAHPIPELPSDHAQAATLLNQYNTEIEAFIDSSPPTQFTPNLDILDRLVASILVQE